MDIRRKETSILFWIIHSCRDVGSWECFFTVWISSRKFNPSQIRHKKGVNHPALVITSGINPQTCPVKSPCPMSALLQNRTWGNKTTFLYLAMRTAVWAGLRDPWHTKVMSVPFPSLYNFSTAPARSLWASVIVPEKQLWKRQPFKIIISGIYLL